MREASSSATDWAGWTFWTCGPCPQTLRPGDSSAFESHWRCRVPWGESDEADCGISSFPARRLAIVSKPETAERASTHTVFLVVGMVALVVIAGRDETRQAGIDPASEAGSCLFQCQRHRPLPRIKADDPFRISWRTGEKKRKKSARKSENKEPRRVTTHWASPRPRAFSRLARTLFHAWNQYCAVLLECPGLLAMRS